MPSELPAGTVVAGRYRIDGLLGSGGMGSVYRAIDADGTRCALKLLHAGLTNDTMVRRFLRESTVASASKSRHVAPVLDAGEHERAPFLVMPLLEGMDAGRLVARVGPLEPVLAARILLQACAGLAELHRGGIVHRDVKPSNLFLAREGDEIVVKIVDFGIAKALTAEEHTQLTKTGSELGSPHYMSPEQARDPKHVDERSDVWSAGITLYRLLTRKVPFDDTAGLGQYLLGLVSREPRSVQDHAPWVDPVLCKAVHGALQRDLARRSSLAVFTEALRSCAGGSEVIEPAMLAPMPEDRRAIKAERVDMQAIYGAAEAGLTDTSETFTVAPRAARSSDGLDALVGRRLDGRFRVVRLVGRGGMGAVFEVETETGERLAAKVIRRQDVEEGDMSSQRFLREANAAISITSPNVVRTHEVGRDPDLDAPFIVMELLQGTDLGTLLRQRGAIEAGQAVRLFVQAARGVAAAHDKGIIHRDIKPANLFLHAGEGGKIEVKVCDFGIAKRAATESAQDQTAHELTQTGGMLGSPMYMSPEQAVSAKKVDHRTDVWSLAASLYEVLSGRKLWAGRSALGEILVAICTQPVIPLRSVAPWVDTQLAAAVHKGLEPQADARYGSMEELIAALEPFAAGPAELTLDDLRPVPEALRASARSDEADRSQGTGAGVSAKSIRSTGTAGPRRGAKRAITVVVVAAAALGLGAYALRSRPARAPAEASGAPAGAASSDAPKAARASARLAILPGDAVVTVDGQELPVQGGGVSLDGAPGQTFEVVVRAGGAEERRSVVMSNDGRAVPDSIEVRPEPTARTAARPAATGTPARKPDAAKSASPSGPATAAGAAPTASATAAKPTFRTDW